MDRELTARQRLDDRLRRLARPLIIIAALALTAAWTFAALRPGARLDTLRISTARVGDLEAVVTALGTVTPAAERVITSPLDSRLLRVMQRPGSRVDAGTALLELELDALELELKQLEGRLAKTRAQRRERLIQLEQQQAELGERWKIAGLELEEARFELEQSRRLADEGLLSASSLRAAETRVKRLEIETEGLQASMQLGRESSAAQLAGFDADLLGLEQEKEQLLTVLGRSAIRAGQAGVLTWVLDEEGASVRRGDVLARLADLASFRIDASISDVHAQRIEVGQRVRAHVGSGDGQGADLPEGLVSGLISGLISQVLPAVEDGTLRFIVELDRPDHPALRAQQRLDVEVITATRQGTLMIERGQTALAGRAVQLFVLTDDGERAVRRRVELGLAGERVVEVRSGLDEGERVILSDLSRYGDVHELRLR